MGKTEALATNFLGNVVGPDMAAAATHTINSMFTSGRTARVPLKHKENLLIKLDFFLRFKKDMLQHGTMVQLVSKSSGRLIQVVMTPHGALTFDGNGPRTAFNSKIFQKFYDKEFFNHLFFYFV